MLIALTAYEKQRNSVVLVEETLSADCDLLDCGPTRFLEKSAQRHRVSKEFPQGAISN